MVQGNDGSDGKKGAAAGTGNVIPRLLLVSVNAEQSVLLRYVLEAAGFAVILAPLGRATLDLRLIERADAIVIDARAAIMRQPDQLELLRHLSRPVVLLADALLSSEDEQMQQHFSILPRAGPPAELIATLRAMLRTRGQSAGILRCRDLEFDLVSWRAFRAGRELALRPIERCLLRLLLSDPHRVFTREQLAQACWRRNLDLSSRIIDIHIAHLRRALNHDADEPLIRTVRGLGYALT